MTPTWQEERFREIILVGLEDFRIGGDGWKKEQTLLERKKIVDYFIYLLISQKEKIIEEIEKQITALKEREKQVDWEDTCRSLEDTILGLKEAISIIKEQE